MARISGFNDTQLEWLCSLPKGEAIVFIGNAIPFGMLKHVYERINHTIQWDRAHIDEVRWAATLILACPNIEHTSVSTDDIMLALDTEESGSGDTGELKTTDDFLPKYTLVTPMHPIGSRAFNIRQRDAVELHERLAHASPNRMRACCESNPHSE